MPYLILHMSHDVYHRTVANLRMPEHGTMPEVLNSNSTYYRNLPFQLPLAIYVRLISNQFERFPVGREYVLVLVYDPFLLAYFAAEELK